MSTGINVWRKQSGPGRGRAVPVYDGRTWPVVKCGAVYVTDSDKTKTVTKNVISLSKADDKKVKTTKYTLAVGSSFGHVHGFLKDTDHVLKSLDKHRVEDKCLLLIKKPKSASKQMLKAHSWANLNLPTMHHGHDGPLNQDIYRTRNSKKGPIKARASDLGHSLPSESDLSGRHQRSGSDLDIQSLSEHTRSSRSLDFQQKQDKKKDINVPNLYSPYPVNTQTKDQKIVPPLDLGRDELELELTNQTMGQGYSTTGEGHVQLNRPNSLPPSVPNNKPNKSHSDKKRSNPNVKNFETEAERSKNRNISRSKSDSEDNMLYIHTKHDSGFYSDTRFSKEEMYDTRLSKEEMYDYGFKQELDSNIGNMTSSPRAKDNGQTSAEKGFSKSETGRVIREKSSGMRPEGQKYSKSQVQGQGNKVSKGLVYPYSSLHSSVDNVNMQMNHPSNHSSAKSNNYVPGTNNKENIQRGHPSKREEDPRKGQNSQQHSVNTSKPSPSNSFRSDRDLNKRKSASDMKESIKISIENGEPVIRTKSLGDLQTGCAFSLVGQKKLENNQGEEPEEFTGSKMTAYYRKLREMKKESKHGSLPFRGRNVDLEGLSQIAEQMESQVHRQAGNQPGNFALKSNKPKHYGSLQYLPMSGTPYSHVEKDSRQIIPARKHIKTPVKPKRCLPQVPAEEIDQKLKHVTDMVKVRMSAGSQSSSSPSSSHSNRAPSNEGRYRFPSNPTPSDKEVSELLDIPESADGVDVSEHPTMTATKQILPSELYSHPAIESINNTNTLHPGNHTRHPMVSSTGGRLSESGQTTLTSQSTIDSGYATNDPDHETIPTSIYAKSLKQSAQSMYKANKLLKPPGGDQPQGIVIPENSPTSTKGSYSQDMKAKGGYSQDNKTKGGYPQDNSANARERLVVQDRNVPVPAKRDSLQTRQTKELHTQNWVNNHPSPGVNIGPDVMYPGKTRHNLQYQSTGNLSLYSKPHQSKMDNNNNNSRQSQPPLTMSSMSESYPQQFQSYANNHSNTGTYPPKPKRQQLSHHPSELSVKDIERMNYQENHAQIRTKGKSLSMSQGLNLIDSSRDYGHHGGQSLAKTHPKFTGSLKDLLGVGKQQIVPVEVLKREDFHQSTGSLFTDNRSNLETSIKSLGKPSLFQILQNYNLYTVRMRIPEHLNIVDNIRMIECEVVLPSSYIFGDETPLSPKGNYAKIGGPNSAFRPVQTGTSSVKTVSMVTVLDMSNELTQTFHTGQIKKGDLIVELNERLMIGEELSTLTSVLKTYRGEVILTLARDKARETQQTIEKNSSVPTDADFRMMEQKILELTKTLQKRDRTIHKLNAFLPWQSPSGKGQNSVSNIEPIISNLSEDEYIV